MAERKHPVRKKAKPKLLTEPLYERQKGESSSAWRAFTDYRDDEEGRSYGKTAANIRRSKRLIEHWGSLWHWQDRVAAWEKYQDELNRAQRFKEKQEALDTHNKVGQAMVALAGTRLTTVDATDLTVKELVMLFKTGMMTQRLVFGEPTENIQTETPQQRRERQLSDARNSLKQSRDLFPNLTDQQLIKMAAQTFGVTEKDLDGVLKKPDEAGGVMC